MATERKSPDAILEITKLAPNDVSYIQDDPDGPDGNWLIADSNNTNVDVRTSFPTPTGDPTVGADAQEFKAYVRQFDTGQGGDPECRLELWENGILIRAGSDELVTGAGQIISFTWNANELGTADGSLVECKLVGTKSGGSPTNRNAVDVAALEWNVTYSVGGIIQYGAATFSGAGTLTGAGVITAVGKGTLSGAGALVTNGVVTAIGKVTLAGAGSLAMNGVVTAIGKVTLTGAGLLAAVGEVFKCGAAILTGAGALVANGVVIAVGKVTLAGAGTFAAVGRSTLVGKVTLAGAGVLAAAGEVFKCGAATLSGAGALTINGVIISVGKATFSGAGTLAAIGRRIVNGVITFAGGGVLGVLGGLLRTGAAALSGGGALGVLGGLLRTGAAALSGGGALGAKGVKIVVAKITTTGTGTLAAIGQVNLIGKVLLSGVGSLAVIGTVGDFVIHYGSAKLSGSAGLTIAGEVIKANFNYEPAGNNPLSFDAILVQNAPIILGLFGEYGTYRPGVLNRRILGHISYVQDDATVNPVVRHRSPLINLKVGNNSVNGISADEFEQGQKVSIPPRKDADTREFQMARIVRQDAALIVYEVH